MRIFGVFFEYVIRWMLPLVALWVATCVWSCWLTWRAEADTPAEPVEAGDGRKMQIGVGIVVACATVLAAGRSCPCCRAPRCRINATARSPGRWPSNWRARSTRRSATRSTRSIRLHWARSRSDLALELEKHSDVHAGVGPWGVAGVTPFRVVDTDEADSTLWYVASEPVIDAFMAVAGCRGAGLLRPP